MTCKIDTYVFLEMESFGNHENSDNVCAINSINLENPEMIFQNSLISTCCYCTEQHWMARR